MLLLFFCVCGFVVSTRGVSCLIFLLLFGLVLLFFSPVQHCDHLGWEERADLCASCAFVCLFCVFLSFVSSSWCHRLPAFCDCGTPWTFLLNVLIMQTHYM